MKWWDDLWLNEGFASFVEYLGVNHVHPNWKMVRDYYYRFSITNNFMISMLIDDGIIDSVP